MDFSSLARVRSKWALLPSQSATIRCRDSAANTLVGQRGPTAGWDAGSSPALMASSSSTSSSSSPASKSVSLSTTVAVVAVAEAVITSLQSPSQWPRLSSSMACSMLVSESWTCDTSRGSVSRSSRANSTPGSSASQGSGAPSHAQR
ncbi:unnamed protein product, partial [Ixodes pacificus]